MGGLPTSGALGQKLWLAARTLSKSPFSDEMQNLTVAQLDWIIEMIAKDNPDRIRIARGGEEALPDGVKMSLEKVALWDTKRGKAKDMLIQKLFNPEQMAKLKAHPRRRQASQTALYLAPNVSLK